RYIGDWAFRMNQITSVSIPDSVVSIGNQAFRYNQLTEISVPQHTRVANNAFDRDVTVIRRLYSKTELQP
ncbi:MAG: leucine-rich repeat domain-containing protein, partial [Treponema sp.]|nr:leucine-rich repeat domain-containing protein [Treponema sp.]